MEQYIDVIGMGPGHVDCLLPIAYKKIQDAQILIGGQRNLDSVKHLDKDMIIIKNNLKDILTYIEKEYTNRQIAVLVSGDPGFHSLLGYLKRNLLNIPIKVTPGLGSISYLFSKLNMSWQNALLSSVHGEDTNYIDLINNNELVVLLTDDQTTPCVIAEKMIKNGIENKVMYIGESLSYPSEKIHKLSIEKAKNYQANKLSIVVIKDA